jgi:hypothetical protein
MRCYDLFVQAVATALTDGAALLMDCRSSMKMNRSDSICLDSGNEKLEIIYRLIP